MHLRIPQIEHKSRVRRVTALLALLALLVVGIAGCASQSPASDPANAAPFVGTFTGEFVDGKPLYRFPAIEIVGRRSGFGAGT